ncbi:MAG: hypothetical protein ACRDYU_17245 [Actinomycetes bacterium]
MPLWSDVADLYQNTIYEPGKQPLFFVLVAFLVGFAFIRFSTRMIRAQVSWWPGNVTPGGLHIHHVVFGVGFMLVGGAGAFSRVGGQSPWAEVFAAVFGVGAALVLDEFALILHLRDVYWTEQGRASVDAVILAVALIGLLVLGFSPLGVAEGKDEGQTGWNLVLTLAANLLLVVVTFLRGKFWTGTIGIIVPFVALVGALRLARPNSPWARARYAPDSRKALRAQAREERVDSRWRHGRRVVGDVVGGRPDAPPPPSAPDPPAG